MSKQAEQAAKEIYKDGIELLGRRDKNKNLIIHPETMVGILRDACQRGYEQAEKNLVLTWKDMQLIWQLCDILNNEQPNLYGSKDFFTEVLNRYNKEKKK